MKKRKKRCPFLFVLLVLTGIAGVVCYLFWDKIKEMIFNSKYEDKYLELVEKVRLLGDLVNWPIDYVRALLP